MNLYQVPGLRYVGHTSHPRVSSGDPLPVFEPVSPEVRPSINTLEGWNALAREANARAFVHVFGRKPVCDAELKAWGNAAFCSDFRWEVTA